MLERQVPGRGPAEFRCSPKRVMRGTWGWFDNFVRWPAPHAVCPAVLQILSPVWHMKHQAPNAVNRVLMRSPVEAVFFLLLSTPWSAAFAQTSLQDEIEQLRKQVAAQQEQINELRQMLYEQSKLTAATPPRSAESQTTTGSEHVVAVAVAETDSSLQKRVARQQAIPAPPQGMESGKQSLAIRAGPLSLAPTGFIDYSQVWRSKTVTSGLPTNFAAIPFNNTVEGQRRQTLSSAANSRLGMQINATFSNLRILGVVETDFLGYQPGNVSTTANSYGLRLRLAFADVQAGKWEILGGQAWTLLTPGRKDISALPGGLMLTEDLDPNIQSGLVWARSPQLRVVYRPRKGIALGASFESGDAYVGGSSGAGTITLPSALAPNYFNQVDLGTGGLAVPNPHLDFIGKIAFDWTNWGRATHLEAAGMVNKFAFYNPLTSQHFSIVGGGASVNAGIEIAKNVTLFTANYYSDGGGRFIYGEAPALIIEGNGAPSLLHAMSTLNGVEYQATPKWRLWAFYGGTYIGRNVAIDPSNGQPVGYGYTGSPDSQNRSIQELTGGFTRVFRRDPTFGTFQFSGQYSWLVRHPSYVAAGQPGSANLNMLYLGLRYLLPAPAAGK